MTSEPQRVYAVLNPAARRFATVRDALVARASASGLPEPIVLTTTPDEPGGPQALHALARGADLVIAGGGDGTVREVASALAGTQIPLGLLPYGTANLFARNLGIAPGRLRANVATALFGRARRVDIGRADFLTDEVWTTEIPFLVVAGIGRDAATVLRTRPEFKRRLGWLAYFASGARQALSPPVPMRVARDDAEPHEVSTWCVLAGNCGRIPGGIRVFPRARPDDGLLDTLEVPLRSRLDWLPVAAKGVLRYPRDVYPLRYGTAQALSVRPAEAMPIHLDGDVVGEVAELRVRVEAAALTVHVPH